LILKNSQPSTSRVDEISRLDFLLAELYADAVKAVARRAGVKISEIDLIGSHGQTIQHLPKPYRIFGKNLRATFQIGDPSVLATRLGITTVGDFRVADMAAGGQGAPLVPYVDWLLFRSRTKNRALLNIGGIANVTLLHGGCSQEEVIAFDTGPGNMVIDSLMERLYGTRYDRNGEVASRGRVDVSLLMWMMKHPYLKIKPPKSTGREDFGVPFIDALIRRSKRTKPEDIVATASMFTSLSVFDALRRHVPEFIVDELIVAGGGCRNRYLVESLRSLFGMTVVRLSEEFGISPEAKEAICFAILANEAIAGRPANLPSVTGARRSVLLGKVCRPLRERERK
jgi:anhydro-N-acetylmuramic acid kinase